MRRLILAALFALPALQAGAQQAADGTFELDRQHADVGVTMDGAGDRFASVEGVIQYNGRQPELSTVSLSCDTTSLGSTASRGAFDADAFPEIRIISASVKSAGAGAAVMQAATTIKDITRPMALQVRYRNVSSDVVNFHAEGDLRPADYKMRATGPIHLVIDAQFRRLRRDTPTSR